MTEFIELTVFESGDKVLLPVRLITGVVEDEDGTFIETGIDVQFVGNPSDIVIDFEGLSSVQDSGWGVPVYEIKTTSNYDFAISFDNFFHQVNPDFVPNFEVSIACFGKVNIDVHTEDDYQQLIALDEKLHFQKGGVK